MSLKISVKIPGDARILIGNVIALFIMAFVLALSLSIGVILLLDPSQTSKLIGLLVISAGVLISLFMLRTVLRSLRKWLHEAETLIGEAK